MEFDPGLNDSYYVSFIYDEEVIDTNLASHQKTKVKQPTRFDFQKSVTSDLDLVLQIYSIDGFLIYSHDYKYSSSSSGLVELPVINVAKPITNTTRSELLISTARSKYITQVHLEGDVADEFNDTWHDINTLSKVPFLLSQGEGEKIIRVKVRDAFNVESDSTEIVVNLDLTKPEDCSVEVASEDVGVALVNVRIQGTDKAGQISSRMRFNASGSLANLYSDVIFEDGDDFWLKLSGEEGVKPLTIAVSDEAGNECAIESFILNYDREWAPFGIELLSGKNYTTSDKVEVGIRIDAFDKTQYQVLIEGMIEEDMGWIDYQESLELTLEPGSGIRHILMRIKEKGVISNILSVNTFANPAVKLIIDDSDSLLELPNMLSAQTMTITGCDESYDNVTYQRSISCTPTTGVDHISVLVQFEDEETLDLNVLD